MKTTITIENGKITVQVDDEPQVTVSQHVKVDLTPVAAEVRPVTLPPASAVTGKTSPKEKICQVCGGVFTPKTVLSRFCSKKCATRFYNKASRERVKSTAPNDKPPGDDSVKYCKHCKAYTTHYSADHPLPGVVSPPPPPLIEEPAFLPGFEKSDEELESWKPRSFPTPTPVPNRSITREIIEGADEIKSAMDEQRAGFDDPWNCGMCRNAGALCLMHEKMTADGKVPPKI